MAGETAEQRTESLRSVAESGYVPAARVAGRPEGWGAGRATERPAERRAPAPARLRRGGGPAAGDGGHRRHEPARRPAVRADRRPADRAGRGDRRPGPDRGPRRRPDRRPRAVAGRASRRSASSLLLDDPRPRRGTPLALAVAGTDGRAVAADGAGGGRRAAPPARTARHAARRPRGQAAARRGASPTIRAADAAPGRVRHPDRRLHPQRRAAQPDDRRCRRREPRPDPAARHRAAGDGPGRPRGAVGDRGPRAARASASPRSRPRAAVPRDRAAADPGARPDGGRRRRARPRGARPSSTASSPRRSPASSRRSTSTSATSSTSAARSSSSRSCSSSSNLPEGQAHEDRLLDRRVGARGAAPGAPDDRQAARVARSTRSCARPTSRRCRR